MMAEITVNEPIIKRRRVKADLEKKVVNEPIIKRRRVKDDLEKVRSYIKDVREKGEDRLLPERELAEAVGVTRSRLRGALKKLVDEEVIWREVGNGTYLGQRPLIGPGGGRKIELSELTNPQEVMEARLLLEPELARRAAMRARGEHITEMELCMQKMSVLTSQSDWSFWDRRFHHAIGRAANNTLLLALLETIQGNMDRGTWGELSEKLHHSSSSEGSMQDHLAILTPIKNRNSTAAYEAMRAHLLRVQNIYFGV
jgi:DNA-binding FadR family transcriptional regulator